MAVTRQQFNATNAPEDTLSMKVGSSSATIALQVCPAPTLSIVITYNMPAGKANAVSGGVRDVAQVCTDCNAGQIHALNDHTLEIRDHCLACV